MSCVYPLPPGRRGHPLHQPWPIPTSSSPLSPRTPKCQYGVDGIVFDHDGNLYVGNFGDGVVHKITFNPDGSVKENQVGL